LGFYLKRKIAPGIDPILPLADHFAIRGASYANRLAPVVQGASAGRRLSGIPGLATGGYGSSIRIGGGTARFIDALRSALKESDTTAREFDPAEIKRHRRLNQAIGN
jgi:hypothetical protein